MRPGPQEGGAEEEGPAVVSSRKAKGAAVGVLQQRHFVAAIRSLDQQRQNVQRVGGDPLPEDETLVLWKTIHTLQQPLGWAGWQMSSDVGNTIMTCESQSHPQRGWATRHFTKTTGGVPVVLGRCGFLGGGNGHPQMLKNPARLRREG